MTIGKNKEQFEKWYRKNYLVQNGTFALPIFYTLEFKMQICVYLAYYDSLDYDVYLDACSCHNPSLYTFIVKNNESKFVYYSYDDYSDFENPIEAYKEALKKADELINQKN